MMPLSIILPDDAEELNKSLTKSYHDTANAINGSQSTWTPTVEGSTTSGIGTYTTQTGYYYRQGLLCDCWFSVTMTAHTGTGDMQIKLPFKIKRSADVWVGSVIASNLTYPSGTSVSLLGTNNTYFVKIIGTGSGIASATVKMTDATCTLTGHIRFVGQAEK